MAAQRIYSLQGGEMKGQLKLVDNNSLSLKVEIILSLAMAKCK
jgi:hypothetical protein